MLYSKKYNYYKFPGGGVLSFETNKQALKREIKEEAGLNILDNSIDYYGCGILKGKGIDGNLLIQRNYYYFCENDDKKFETNFEEYEKEEEFVLEWANALRAIAVNMGSEHFGKNSVLSKAMFERESRVLKSLLDDGYVSEGDNGSGCDEKTRQNL